MARTILILLAMAMIVVSTSALGRWKPEYANAPPEVREWYSSREIAPAARHRFSFRRCCDDADVVRTKFKVGGAGNDEWFWLNASEWQRIPDDIIHWDEHAPDGHAVLFVNGDTPTCFFPPEGKF